MNTYCTAVKWRALCLPYTADFASAEGLMAFTTFRRSRPPSSSSSLPPSLFDPKKSSSSSVAVCFHAVTPWDGGEGGEGVGGDEEGGRGGKESGGGRGMQCATNRERFRDRKQREKLHRAWRIYLHRPVPRSAILLTTTKRGGRETKGRNKTTYKHDQASERKMTTDGTENKNQY